MMTKFCRKLLAKSLASLILGILCLTAITYTITIAPQAFATSDSNNHIAKINLTKLLGNIKRLQGDFTQFEYDERGRPLRTLQGKFKLADKTKLRWEVNPPYSQTIISNGTHVLVYDEDLRQLLIRTLDVDQLPPFFFLANNPQILETMDVEQPDSTQPTFILSDGDSEILVYFENNLPFEISWSNELKQRITIQFAKLQKNRRIRASEFSFTPPPDTDIIIDDN